MSEKLESIDSICFITPENAKFTTTEGGFLSLKFNDKEYARVNLLRAFPFKAPNEYISVTDTESKEIGIISDLVIFTGSDLEAINKELARRYFTPSITKIVSVKEQFGYSYWNVETEMGPTSFAVMDTFRNIVKAEDRRFFINDVEGNRYEITDLEKLDLASIKKIEIYI